MSIKASWIHLSSLAFQSVPVQITISLHPQLSVTESEAKKITAAFCGWFITLTALILDTFEPCQLKVYLESGLSFGKVFSV